MRLFRTILAATDLVETPDPVVVSALKTAIHQKALLIILHVLESTSDSDRSRVRDFRSREDRVAGAEYVQEVLQALRNTYYHFLRLHDPVDILVKTGFPWMQVIAQAFREKADAIFLGPHAGRAAQRGVVRVKGRVGSTVEGVTKYEPCPTWIVNRIISARMVRLARILVGVDYSDSCRAALRYAVDLARSASGRLILFHMHGVPPSPHYSKARYDADVRRCYDRLQQFGAGIPAAVAVEYYVCGGSHPHLEIVRGALKFSADLIVMGSHTKSQDPKWYVGSAVERVSHRSPCPVAVVTDPSALMVFSESAGGSDS
jgi:nucleotide-binding universal stress UspA family protein